VVLDTPYGFQENANELASRAVEYFKVSVNVDLQVAGLTRLKPSPDGIAPSHAVVEKGFRAVDDAHYLFAGPGSPTYSMQQWSQTPVRELLTRKLERGGIITFASAAALTLGKRTVPVYEIYKVGMDPYWNDGLAILQELGIPASVIPHYDNAEGGSHDTRFCYLGERRLQMLESDMEDDEYVLGVDEHTGLVINLDDESAQVVGNSTVTLRKGSKQVVFSSGDRFSLDELRSPSLAAHASRGDANERAERVGRSPKNDSPPGSGSVGSSLIGSAESLRKSFDEALERGDADAAIDGLGEIAVGGLRDPRSVVAPFVEGLLALRKIARDEKRFDLSDVVRDRLLAAGVEVRDTKDGVEWVLKPQV